MTLKRSKNEQAPKLSVNELDRNWVACILEIRAADEHHVFARVYWLYWPDELPPGTLEGKKSMLAIGIWNRYLNRMELRFDVRA